MNVLGSSCSWARLALMEVDQTPGRQTRPRATYIWEEKERTKDSWYEWERHCGGQTGTRQQGMILWWRGATLAHVMWCDGMWDLTMITITNCVTVVGSGDDWLVQYLLILKTSPALSVLNTIYRLHVQYLAEVRYRYIPTMPGICTVLLDIREWKKKI